VLDVADLTLIDHKQDPVAEHRGPRSPDGQERLLVAAVDVANMRVKDVT
jgi:hypothetical protein